MTGRHGQTPIPSEGRLLRTVRQAAEHARNATIIAKLTPDNGPKLERPTRAIDPGDNRTLRGIPAIGRGVAGAIPGTQPDAITNRQT